MRKFSIGFFAVFTVIAFSQASQAVSNNYKCQPTPSEKVLFYPGKDKVEHSNNLRRKAGSPDFAAGTPMLITGRIVDKECVPMMDVVVEMWQANSYGSYNSSSKQKNKSAPDSNFSGSGRAVTDNNGEFQFLTIYPGASGSQSPRLYFRVLKSGKVDFNTTLFLADSTLTYDDKDVKKLKSDARQRLLAYPELYEPQNPSRGYKLNFEFVMGEDQKYREF